MQEQDLSLIRLIETESPRIHQALEKAIELLPAPVQKIASHVVLAGGKRLRPLLTLTTARLLGRDDEELYRLCAVPELIHTASLLHDDILDEAETRRGKAAAHTIYGLRPALLTGDAMLALADCEVTTFGRPDMVSCVSNAMMRTVSGEAHEISLQGSLEHSEKEYIDVIAGKTGWLIRASCRLGALYANATPEQVQAASDYGLAAGIAFQMVDDALDFEDSAVTGKPCGGDLREGKYTPPVMFYVSSLNKDERADFETKFKNGTFSDEEVASISAKIREDGFASATRTLADDYLNMAEVSLYQLPKNPQRDILREVIPYIRNRKK